MAQRLRCVVVDDDAFSNKIVSDIFKYSPYAENTNSFTSPKRFLEALHTLDFDVYLLDIDMSEMDGLLVAKQLNGKPVIFMTGKDAVLRDAFDMSPIDIVTKPILKSRLNDALYKAYLLLTDNKNDNKEYLFLNVAGSKEKVKFKMSDIFLVTTDCADTEHKHLFLKDGQRYTVTDCTLEGLSRYSKLFVQPNKSELVSIEAIDKIVHNNTIVLNGIKENGAARKVVLSRSFKKRLFEQV